MKRNVWQKSVKNCVSRGNPQLLRFSQLAAHMKAGEISRAKIPAFSDTYAYHGGINNNSDSRSVSLNCDRKHVGCLEIKLDNQGTCKNYG